MTAWTIIARALWRLVRPPWFLTAEYHSIRHLREHGAEAMLDEALPGEDGEAHYKRVVGAELSRPPFPGGLRSIIDSDTELWAEHGPGCPPGCWRHGDPHDWEDDTDA